MTSKKLIIITEGGKNTGFGHITRAIAITNNFIDYGYCANFIINGDASISNILKQYPHKIFNWIEEKDNLIRSIKNADLILLDSILISNNQIKQLESLSIPIIFIDDDKQRNILDSGFVVDWTILTDKQNNFLPQKEKVKYLLGGKFTPLRDSFNSATPVKINHEINKIMMTFGGSDIRNLTPKILHTLNQHFPNLQKDIIVGNGFENQEDIKKLSTQNTNFIYNATTQDMINSMQTSDIAIASGGQTLYELAKIGLPTIAILVVENAKADTLGWEEVGFLKYIGEYNNQKLEQNLLTALEQLSEYETRLAMQQNGLKNIGQNGGKLLVQEIMKDLNDTF